MSNQRYKKLVEFAAHAGDVRCVRIGRKTAGVLVTGGDDKKVNVWALGKTTASFSLSGHTSSVESVSFDNDEMVVAAGASNGSIKVFELQTGKVTKSLSGHKSNVTCLAWHPYDSTIISGSMDTNVKLWNLRDKDAITSFKGHNASVTHVRFAPDGNWVASASSDGSVKIWDVRGGKIVTDLCQPTKYEITGLEFSPTEYLLATSSRDKLVRFWDLETFTNIDQTQPEATPVRNICFTNDGRSIFSAVQDGCKVWSVDPTEQQDYVDVPWYRVSDLAVSTVRSTQRLIGCSFNSTMVGIFYIVLKNVRPFCDDPDFMAREAGGASVDGNPYAGGGVGSSRSNIAGAAAAAQLPPEAAVRRLSMNDRATGGERPGSVGAGESASYGNGAGGRQAGPSQSASVGVGRSAERAGSAGSRPPTGPSGAGGLLPPVALYGPSGGAGGSAHGGGGGGSSSSRDRYANADGPGDSAASEHVVAAARAVSGQGAGARAPMVSVGVGVGDSLMRGQLAPEDLQRGGGGAAAPSRQRSYSERPQQRDPPVEVHAPAYPRAPPPQAPSRGVDRGEDAYAQSHSVGTGPDQRYSWQGQQGAGSAAGPSGADRGGGGGGGGGSYASVVPSDLEAASSLSSRHTMFSGAMKKRAHALALIRNFVAKCDWRGAISCARRCDEPAAFADLLAAMHERRDAFSLELVGEVVSVLDTVLSLPSDRQLQVGLDAVSVHVRYFGPIIKELCGPGARGVGIDLSFEERRERAAKARLALQSLVPKLNALARQSDTMGSRAGDLASQLAQL